MWALNLEAPVLQHQQQTTPDNDILDKASHQNTAILLHPTHESRQLPSRQSESSNYRGIIKKYLRTLLGLCLFSNIYSTTLNFHRVV